MKWEEKFLCLISMRMKMFIQFPMYRIIDKKRETMSLG